MIAHRPPDLEAADGVFDLDPQPRLVPVVEPVLVAEGASGPPEDRGGNPVRADVAAEPLVEPVNLIV
jgi:hypothetical protein